MRGGLPGGPDDKESACNTRDLGLISWRREWLPTPVFLSGEFHGQRRMAGRPLTLLLTCQDTALTGSDCE